MIRKFQSYWWYLQSPTDRDPESKRRRVNVLLVATGERRVFNMMETLRDMPKPNRKQRKPNYPLTTDNCQYTHEKKSPRVSVVQYEYRTGLIVIRITTFYTSTLLLSAVSPELGIRPQSQAIPQ